MLSLYAATLRNMLTISVKSGGAKKVTSTQPVRKGINYITYRYFNKLKFVDKLSARFAPGMENNTGLCAMMNMDIVSITILSRVAKFEIRKSKK